MPARWYDVQLTRCGRDVGSKFSDVFDLDQPEAAKARLLLSMRSAIVRTRGSLRDLGEYALDLRERDGRDVLMTFATFGEVEDR
jgi:hypothetical protein